MVKLTFDMFTSAGGFIAGPARQRAGRRDEGGGSACIPGSMTWTHFRRRPLHIGGQPRPNAELWMILSEMLRMIIGPPPRGRMVCILPRRRGRHPLSYRVLGRRTTARRRDGTAHRVIFVRMPGPSAQ